MFFLSGSYLKTTTELRRLSQISSSPIISNISETIIGLTSIRAFDIEEHMKTQFSDRVELNNKAYMHEAMTLRYMSFWMDMLVAVIVSCVGFFVALTRYVSLNSTDDIKSYGFVLAILASLGPTMPLMLVTLTECTKCASSIQRLHEYYYCTELEAEYEDPKAPKDWPKNGDIEIKNLCLKYRKDLPLVLKNIDISIKGREKIGVVGRTGSGKSTIILAFMRIIEMEEDELGNPVGSIKIDNLQIDQIGLHELRRKVTIIPQDPV